MEELIKNIKEGTEVFMQNLEKFAGGNKSAGMRARKASLELEKLYKQFRKESVK